MKPLFKKYAAIYKYFLGYGWLCMYMEECIKKTRTTIKDRYIFPIDVACELPVFPSCEDPHMNPYLPLLVNSKVLNSSQNCHSVPMLNNHNHYGVTLLQTFKTNFNIFTTGNPTKNLFDGLETDSNGKWLYFGIGGSVITACAEKRSPLYNLVKKPNDTYVNNIERYFLEYYSGSDLDMMCNETKLFPFMDQVNMLINVISKNIKDNNMKIKPYKTICIFVHPMYLEKVMLNEFESVNYIKKNFKTDEINEYFYATYVSNKININRSLRKQYGTKNPLYNNYYKISSSDDMIIYLSNYEHIKDNHCVGVGDVCVYLNDILSKNEQVAKEKNIMIMRISENIKFQLSSPKMVHNIDVFRLKYTDIFSTVSRFHLPCVRGYYDGNNVYLLPSFISAMMTHMNLDYKYFAGVRDPINIINKYRMRGFGTFINDNEKIHMTNYNGNIDKWNGMFGIDIKNNKSIISQFGPRNINDKIYKPNHHKLKIPLDSYSKINDTSIISIKDLYEKYRKDYNYNYDRLDILAYKTINKDGSVNPLNLNLISLAFDEINNNSH
jgi:hypothetical protein